MSDPYDNHDRAARRGIDVVDAWLVLRGLRIVHDRKATDSRPELVGGQRFGERRHRPDLDAIVGPQAP